MRPAVPSTIVWAVDWLQPSPAPRLGPRTHTHSAPAPASIWTWPESFRWLVRDPSDPGRKSEASYLRSFRELFILMLETL